MGSPPPPPPPPPFSLRQNDRISGETLQSQYHQALFVCLFLFRSVLVNNWVISRTGPKTDVWQFYVLPHMRQSRRTMTSVSAGHIILTLTQPVGSGRPQWESNPGPPHQKSRALPTELPPPPPPAHLFLGSNKLLSVLLPSFFTLCMFTAKCLKQIHVFFLFCVTICKDYFNHLP